MQTQSILFRLSAALAVGGLLLGPTGAPIAQAQAEATAQGDPPSRVGRLAEINGTVSTRTTADTDWSPATLNIPVTSGNAFWTEPAASAGLDVDATHLTMDQSTELDVDTLDDHTLAATVPQGAVFLNVAAAQPGDSYQFTTPRGVVTITQTGHYEVVAGDTTNPTTVTVVDGAAQVQATGSTETLNLQPHQTAQITGADTFQASVGPEADDALLTAQMAPPPAPPVAAANSAPPPPVVAQMTGGAELMSIGSWQPTPQYGNVWYPPVAAGWVPYRQGHWAFVRPWGWTWVDNAPWGFAPFHYGRWVQVGPRWGWIASEPGVAVGVRPVYAPALVAFIGLGAGVAVGAAIGASVGWIPLGPREVYRPPYRVSQNYIRNVNVTNVTNVTTINTTTINNTTVTNYANRGAATVVPATAMTSSQPIGRQARPVTPQQLAAARPAATVPVQPTAATAGVTPAVARQLKLPPAPPSAATARPAAPGPAVQPRAKGAAVPLRPASPIKPVVAQPGRPAVTPPATGAKPAVVQPGKPPATPPATEAKPAVVQPGKPPATPPATEAKPAVVQPGKPATAPPATEAKPAVVQPGRPAAAPRATEAKPAVVQPGKPPATEAKPAVVQPGRPPARPPATEAKPAVVQPGRPPARPPATEAKPAVVQPSKPPAAPPATEAKPAPAAARPVARPPTTEARPAPAAARPPVTEARPAPPAAKPAPPAAKPAPAPAAARPEPRKCPAGQTTC